MAVTEQTQAVENSQSNTNTDELKVVSTKVQPYKSDQRGTKVDYLTEDKNVPAGQKWVCVSFLSPEGLRNCTIRGLKIRGVFADETQARKFAAELQKEDPLFHIFVGEMGKWLPWDQDPNTVKDQNYYEEELQKLMKAKIDNSEKAKVAEKQRRQEMLEKSVMETKKTKKENARERLRRQLDEKNAKKDIEKARPVPGQVDKVDKVDNKEVAEKEQLAAKERARLAENESKIVQEEAKLKTIDENISKIKAIYEQMQKKKTAQPEAKQSA
jgi:hypothetical protein